MRLTKREEAITPKSSDYGRIQALQFIMGAESTRDIRRELAKLPDLGKGWHTANYRTTLEAAIRERTAK